jgi:tetratricopeptide (TPR) repeat protein
MSLEAGSKFRHYTMGGVIGRGGMGLVYKAHDTRLDRDVAIKILFENLATQEEFKRRFLREAQAVARIDHPNVVTIYEVVQDEETCAIVMELLNGRPLSDLLVEEPVKPLSEILNIVHQITLGLQCSHELGVYHRDIKPGNVILNESGVAKILDFGLARVEGLSAITMTGNVMGTIDYIAPEQVLNEPIDHRSDLYSLGILLYEMLAGKRPFKGTEPISVVYQHINDDPITPSTYRAGLPMELDQLVLTLLSKQPSDRYQSAGDLLTDLDICRGLVEAGGTEDGQVTVTLDDRPVQVGVPIAQPRDEFNADLVGREDEQEILHEAVRKALVGDGQLTFLAGSEGTGKTRLAVDALEYADEQGMWTLFGSCLYHEISMPYQPFVDALSQRLSSAKTGITPVGYARLRARILEETPEVASLMPHVWSTKERRTLEAHAPPGLSPKAEQQRLFQAIMHLMLSMAKDRGVVLCMDDLHWGDSGSVQLLHYLARQLPGRRLHLIATYRPEEIEDGEDGSEAPLSETMGRMASEGIGSTVSLSNLNEAHVRSLVHEIVGSRAVPVPITDRVFTESGGNPLFVIEVLKWWRDKTQLDIKHTGWENLEQLVDNQDIAPPRINDLIERRLSRLQDAERELLEVAAIGGNRFDVTDVASVTGAAEMNVLRQLVQLERRHGIVAAVEGSIYQYTHGKIRDVLERELPDALRQAYHGAWAKVFLAREQAGEDIPPEVLANHLFSGGEEEAALPYLKQSAERAKKMSAYREARKYWEQVDATIVQESTGRLERANIDVDLNLGRIYSNQGELDAATERYKKAFKAAKVRGDERSQGDALMALGAVLRSRNQWDGALKLFEQSRLLYERNGDKKGIAAVNNYMGSIAYWRGQWKEARDNYERSLAIYTELQEAVEVASMTSNLGGVAYAIGDDLSAIEYFKRSAEGHRQTNNVIGIAEVDANLGVVYERTEQWNEAITRHKESVELFERMGNNRQLWHTYLNYARVLARTDELDLAEEFCQKSKTILNDLGNKRGLAEARRVEGIIATMDSRWNQATRFFNESIELCEDAKDPYGKGETLRELALMYFKHSDLGAARTILERARDSFNEIGANGDVSIINRKISEIQQLKG